MTPTVVDQDITFDCLPSDDFTRRVVPGRFVYRTDQPWTIGVQFAADNSWPVERATFVAGLSRATEGEYVDIRPGHPSGAITVFTFKGDEESTELLAPTSEVRKFLDLCNGLTPQLTVGDTVPDFLAHHGPCPCAAYATHPHHPVEHRSCNRVPACGGCHDCISADIRQRAQ